MTNKHGIKLLQRRKANKKRTIAEASGMRCWYCGVEFDRCLLDATLDHVVPKSKDGPRDESNLVAACYGCNAEKADMSVEEFRARRGGITFHGEIYPSESRNVEMEGMREEAGAGQRLAGLPSYA